MNSPFEGVEKRLIIQFDPSFLLKSHLITNGSLQSLPKYIWDYVLQTVSCRIISYKFIRASKYCNGCIAYLLSESSLFVYDTRIILKTCGKTTPLLIIKVLLDILSNETVCSLSKQQFLKKNDIIQPILYRYNTSSDLKQKYAPFFLYSYIILPFFRSSILPSVTFKSYSLNETTQESEISLLKCSEDFQTGRVENNQYLSEDICIRNTRTFHSKLYQDNKMILPFSIETTIDLKRKGACLFSLKNQTSLMEGIVSVIFTHLNYCFPDQQYYPHRSFQEEIEFLTDLVNIDQMDHPVIDIRRLKTSKDYELFFYAYHQNPKSFKTKISLQFNDIMMFHIHPKSVELFAGVGSGGHFNHVYSTDTYTGLSVMQQNTTEYKQDTITDEFWFDPCGYSCNILFKNHSNQTVPLNYIIDNKYDPYTTNVHISPEKESSYASIETSLPLCYQEDDYKLIDQKNTHLTKVCIEESLTSFLPQVVHIVQIILTPDQVTTIPLLPIKKTFTVLSQNGRISTEYQLKHIVQQHGSLFTISCAEYSRQNEQE